MKKKLLYLLCSIITISIMGCSSSSESTSEKETTISEDNSVSQIYKFDNSDIYIITDPETGVQYLVYSHREHLDAGMGGITPRLNADGTIMVSEIHD